MFALTLFNVFNISNIVVSISLLSIVILLKRLRPKGKLVISDRLKYSFELLAVLLLFGNLVKVRGVDDAQWIEILANIFAVIAVTVSSLILYMFLFRYKIEKKTQENIKKEEEEPKLHNNLENNFQAVGDTLLKIQTRLNALLDRMDNKLK